MVCEIFELPNEFLSIIAAISFVLSVTEVTVFIIITLLTKFIETKAYIMPAQAFFNCS